jgi:4-hydroxy-tetrahydrodipicolinate synthase
MSITPFAADLAFDEAAYRRHLERMVHCGVSVYLASPGSGEGHALSADELRRVYEVGVDVCKGKVQVLVNLPEARTAQQTIERARIAMAAGVDAVQIYTVDAGHGMRPTAAEQEAYFRNVLDAIDYPVGLSVNILAAGYLTPIGVLKRLCDDYSSISFINVMQPPTSYLAELISAVGPRVEYYVGAEMLAEGLTLNVSGCLTGHANVVPLLIRAIGHSFAVGRIEESGCYLLDLFRLNGAVARFGLDSDAPTSWSARWIKAAMTALDLPGHSQGRMRPPYLTPSRADMDRLADMLRAIDVAGMESRAQQMLGDA